MTPAQRIKREILIDAAEEGDITINCTIDETNVDALYRGDDTEDGDRHCDTIRDYEGNMRESGIPSGIPPRHFSRHYECSEVAYKLRDGTWVGWTYWHGGGKYGEPEAIDWIDDAYDLDVTETEKMMIVREFKVKKATVKQ